MTNIDKLHELIRQKLAEQDLNMFQISKKAGLCSGHLSRIVSKEKFRNPSFETVVTLFHTLDIKFAQLDELMKPETKTERHSRALYHQRRKQEGVTNDNPEVSQPARKDRGQEARSQCWRY